jgi:hypothetical protein
LNKVNLMLDAPPLARVIPIILTALGERPIALGIAGSLVATQTGNDIDVIAIYERGYRRRMRSRKNACQIDAFAETEASIRKELRHPSRAAIVRLLAGQVVIWDSSGLLSDSKIQCAALLAKPAPHSVYESEFTLVEALSDALQKYRTLIGPIAQIVRSSAITLTIPLACYRLGIWPDAFGKVMHDIWDSDARLAHRIEKAATGDDIALFELCDDLIGIRVERRSSIKIPVNQRLR